MEVNFAQFKMRFWNLPGDGEQEIQETPQRQQTVPRLRFEHKLF